MCGLYSLRKSAGETRALFAYPDLPEFPPRPHVAPGQPIACVRIENGERRFALVRWGFVPAWMKEVKGGRPIINARGETVMEKPTFRNAFRRRRCLIPADGFYQWLGDVPGRKVAFFAHKPDDELFALAGLWEHWLGADGSELETALILTVAPNRELSEIHDRMPVVIAPSDFATWLSGEESAALALIRTAPDRSFIVVPANLPRKSAASTKELPNQQLDLF